MRYFSTSEAVEKVPDQRAPCGELICATSKYYRLRPARARSLFAFILIFLFVKKDEYSKIEKGKRL